MSTKISKAGMQILLCAFIGGIPAQRVFSQAYPYAVIDLGELPDTGPDWAEALNNLGQVVGTCQDPNLSGYKTRGFLWDPDRYMQSLDSMMDSGFFPNGEWTWPYDINDQTQAVGWSEYIPAQEARAFLFEDLDEDFQADAGEMDELGIYLVHSRANGVNELGNATGYTYTQSYPQVISPFLYIKETDSFDVKIWQGRISTAAEAINEYDEFRRRVRSSGLHLASGSGLWAICWIQHS